MTRVDLISDPHFYISALCSVSYFTFFPNFFFSYFIFFTHFSQLFFSSYSSFSCFVFFILFPQIFFSLYPFSQFFFFTFIFSDFLFFTHFSHVSFLHIPLFHFSFWVFFGCFKKRYSWVRRCCQQDLLCP